jgi:hypothetical protein
MTSFGSAMQKMQYEGLVEFITKHNALVAKINASTGDRESLAESIRESDEFSDLREQIAKLQDQLDVAVNEKVEAALANADTDTTALQDEVKELKSTITTGASYYKKLYGEEAANEIPKVDRIKGQRSGGGSGGKRIRGYNWVVTVGDDVTEYENAASTAKALAVDTAQLQEHFFAKAGVEQLKDAPDEVVFGLSWVETDEDGTETQVNATIKAYRTGPSGPPTNPGTPSETAEASDEAEPTEADLAAIDEDDLSNV